MDSSSGPAESASVEIVRKASALLEVLGRRGQCTMAQLAELTGEPKSTTYRLVSVLHDFGWIDQGSGRGLYRLGIAMIRLGGLVEGRLDLQGIARPVLRELRGRSAGTWTLFVRRGLRAVCIEVVPSRVAMQFASPVGHSLPLGRAAAPAALVAFLPPHERHTVARHLRRHADVVSGADGSAAQIGAGVLQPEEVQEVRDAGYTVDVGESTPGVASVAAPVFNRRGELEAAVCLGGLPPDDPYTMSSDVVQLVLQAARQVSEGLGHEMWTDGVEPCEEADSGS